MARYDDIGLFWQDVRVNKKADRINLPMPEVLETGWTAPTSFPNLACAQVISLDTETKDPNLTNKGPGWARNDGHIVGVSLGARASDGTLGQWYFPVRHEGEPETNMDPNQVFPWLQHVLGNKNQPKIGANITYDLGWLRHEGISVAGDLVDVQFAESLLSEADPVALEALGQKYLGQGKESNYLYQWLADWFGGNPTGKQRQWIYKAPPRMVGPYAESDANLPLRLASVLYPLLVREGLLNVFIMECKLIRLMIDMRYAGVNIDIDAAEQLRGVLQTKQDEEQAKLDHMCGIDVNVNSSDSIAPAFDAFGIPYNWTKPSKNFPEGKPSFTKAFLESVDHPVANLIKEVRKLAKLKGTFVESYLLDSHINGMVYGQFHQLRSDDGGTRSGRFSCVAHWTPIQTIKGLAPIKDIIVGDYVWTHKERWQKVTHTWIKGQEEMFDVLFCNGEVLTCTTDHKVLDCSGNWIKIGDLINARIPEMASSRIKYKHGSKFISQSRVLHHQRNSRSDGNTLSQYPYCNKTPYARSRTQSLKESPIFKIETWNEESNERQNRRTASCLYRRNRRRLRLYDYKGKRGKTFRSPDSYGKGCRSTKSAKQFRCSPYRWKSQKQLIRQSCFGFQKRASNYPLLAGKGQQECGIKEINYRGSFDVYDITIAVDESYLACGIYSHNSSTPNLQNIPSRDEILAPLIRGLFIPDYGHVAWRKYDYSQIEYRLLIHFAVGLAGDVVRAYFWANPNTDYHIYMQELVKAATGLFIERKPIKSINFGLIYGMGVKALAVTLKLSVKAAKALMDSYFVGVPFAKPTMEAATKEALQTGIITTLSGRKSRFDLWEPNKWGTGAIPLPLHLAQIKYGVNIKRAAGHKALNRKLQGSAADIIKRAMLKCYEDGIYAYIGVPRLTVHDENNHSDYGGVNDGYLAMKHIFETATPVNVPIKLDGDIGPDWGHVVAITPETENVRYFFK